MKRRKLLMAGGAALLTACAARSGDKVFEALKSGGHVIYFRHAATDRRGVDLPDWPRARQRNLSEFGKLQSRNIGAGIRARGVPIGEVRVSPFFRCIDMAELAFGRFEADRNLLSTANADAGTAARIAYLQRRISTPFEGPNLVLISHSRNISDAAGVAVDEGDAAVFLPLGSGRTDHLGTIAAERW